MPAAVSAGELSHSAAPPREGSSPLMGNRATANCFAIWACAETDMPNTSAETGMRTPPTRRRPRLILSAKCDSSKGPKKPLDNDPFVGSICRLLYFNLFAQRSETRANLL